MGLSSSSLSPTKKGCIWVWVPCYLSEEWFKRQPAYCKRCVLKTRNNMCIIKNVMRRRKLTLKTLLIFIISFSLLHIESEFNFSSVKAGVSATQKTLLSDNISSSEIRPTVISGESRVFSLSPEQHGEELPHSAQDVCLSDHHCAHSHCFHALAPRLEFSSHSLIVSNNLSPSSEFIESPFLMGIFRPPALI